MVDNNIERLIAATKAEIAASKDQESVGRAGVTATEWLLNNRALHEALLLGLRIGSGHLPLTEDARPVDYRVDKSVDSPARVLYWRTLSIISSDRKRLIYSSYEVDEVPTEVDPSTSSAQQSEEGQPGASMSPITNELRMLKSVNVPGVVRLDEEYGLTPPGGGLFDI